jgi:lysophospholipase L1-like esterase
MTAERARRRRPWLRLLALGILASLLLGEAALRVTAWALRRDRVADISRSERGWIIYCIGDSFTYGLRVDPSEAYPRRLAHLLFEDPATRSYGVKNLGWPGLSSSNAVFAVSKAIRFGDAALILVLAGWNVNNSDFERLALARGEKVAWTTRLDTFLDRSRLYRTGKQALTYRARTTVLEGIKIVPQAPRMDLYNFREYQEIAASNLTRIATLCRDFDAPLVFLNYPYRDLPPNPYTRNEYYHVMFSRTPLAPSDYIVADRKPDEIAIHSVIRHVGAEQGVAVIDLHEAFVRSGRSDLFQSDYHHPTAQGHALMARAIYEAIAPGLRRAGRSDGAQR